MGRKTNPELVDDENPQWTPEDFARARPAPQSLPRIFSAVAVEGLLRARGRPRLDKPKERINIRLSHEVVEHFRATGEGWQSRIDEALREVVSKQAPKI